jgi:hypothetical protein
VDLGKMGLGSFLIFLSGRSEVKGLRFDPKNGWGFREHLFVFWKTMKKILVGGDWWVCAGNRLPHSWCHGNSAQGAGGTDLTPYDSENWWGTKGLEVEMDIHRIVKVDGWQLRCYFPWLLDFEVQIPVANKTVGALRHPFVAAQDCTELRVILASEMTKA